MNRIAKSAQAVVVKKAVYGASSLGALCMSGLVGVSHRIAIAAVMAHKKAEMKHNKMVANRATCQVNLRKAELELAQAREELAKSRTAQFVPVEVVPA